MRVKPHQAIFITLKFVVAGIVWLLFSEALVNHFAQRSQFFSLQHIQLLKGLFFVGIAGGFLFLVLQNIIERSARISAEFDVVFSNHVLAMGMIDCDTYRFIDVNESALKLFGMTRKEIISSSLGDFVSDEHRSKFEEVFLFLRTGFDQLGTWRFRRKGAPNVTVELSARKINSRNAYLISFDDVSEKLQLERELRDTQKNIQQLITKQTDKLERANEELAYRASQTEHVNAELILVNEKLLSVNKRVAMEAEKVSIHNRSIYEIFSMLKQVVCLFDLTGAGTAYLSPGTTEFFGVDEQQLMKPWFWLHMIRTEDASLRDRHQRDVFERGESCGIFRMITGNLSEKKVFVHLRIYNDSSGIKSMACSFFDVTDFPAIEGDLPLTFKTA